MLVRVELAEGHSHTVELPDRPPAEESVFWTSEGSDGSPPHAVIWGGSRRFGRLLTELAGHDNTFVPGPDPFKQSDDRVLRYGRVVPEQPDGFREHQHALFILE